MKIAFIGLGNMGGPMALNLHKAGHDVGAFDLSRPACDRLAADGAHRHRRQRLRGGCRGGHQHAAGQPACGGAFPGRRPTARPAAPTGRRHAGDRLLDHRGGHIAQVADAARERGIAFIDAPVSGGTGAPSPAR